MALPHLFTSPLPQNAQKLTQFLIDKAISGVPPLVGAAELAQQYRDRANFPHDEARLSAMLRWEISKSFTAGFITGLGGFAALPIALPSNLGATWLLQARMAATVAELRGHSLRDPWVQSMVLVSLMGAAAPELLRRAGVNASQWAMKRALSRMSDKALVQLHRRVGARLVAVATGRSTVQMGRLVPVVGAVVGGAFDAYAARSVARAARHLFMPKLLLT